MLTFILLENKAPIHDPTDAVVNCRFSPGILPRHNPSLAVAHVHARKIRGADS